MRFRVVRVQENGGELHRSEEVDHLLLHDDQHLYAFDRSVLDSVLHRIVSVGTGGCCHDLGRKRSFHLYQLQVAACIKHSVGGVHDERYG